MANTVRDGEMPHEIVTVGDLTYILYPDYSVADKTVAGWAIKRIDSTDANGVTIQWANGTKTKNNAANDLAGLTYKNLV